MIVRSLGLGASLAMAASAIMIPSTTSVEALGLDVNSLSVEALSKPQIFSAPCALCAFENDEFGGTDDTKDIGTELVHTLSIDTKRNEFIFDGAALFPPMGVPAPMYVHLAPFNGESDKDSDSRLLVDEYLVFIDGSETVSEDGFEIIKLAIHINKIEGQDVRQEVRVLLGKDAEGSLFIVNIQLVPEVVSSADNPQKAGVPAAVEECPFGDHPTLCKLRETVLSTMHKMMEKMKSSRVRPCRGSRKGGYRHKHHSYRPHRHHGHRHRHRLHPLIKLLLLPIIGFIVGMGIYFVGWLFGTSVAIIYLFLRRHRPRYQRVLVDGRSAETSVLPEYENCTKDESKVGLLSDTENIEGEAPPLYTDVADEEAKV